MQSQQTCSTCKQTAQNYQRARSAFVYQQPIDQFIKKLKFYNKRFYVEILAEYLSITYFKHVFTPDVITYVPMTQKSQRKRGYNQSKLLALGLSSRVNVEVVDCLEKVKETQRQSKLTKSQRQKNLKGAFKVVNKSLIKNKRVLLVDDVLTTGTTVNAVCEKLLKAGAVAVDVLTVASVPPKEGY
ncbi:MAG: ComF family protein [Clostridia bacterium]|nr:ComF family protein [Clostridia bacterium]